MTFEIENNQKDVSDLKNRTRLFFKVKNFLRFIPIPSPTLLPALPVPSASAFPQCLP